MNLVAIETADSGILAVTPDGFATDPSPGIALLDGPSPIVGRAAAEQERLLPRRVHDCFWERLDEGSLGKPHPTHLTPADLVHAHLGEVRAAVPSPIDGALAAVPGHYDRPWLGYLLGVMEASKLPVQGLVDAAVAAVAQEPQVEGNVLHVDLLLHRTVMTWLAVDSAVVRQRVESEDGVGLTGFRDSWARHIAAQFIRTTRFDPLKLAATEQDLYDRLPQVLSQLATSSEIEVLMSAGGRDYGVKITRIGLIQSCLPLSRRIVRLAADGSVEPPKRMVLSDRAGVIPGLLEGLSDPFGAEPGILGRGAAARGALQFADQLVSSSGEVLLTTNLRVIEASDTSPSPNPIGQNQGPRDGRGATHLLYRGHAYPITEEPLLIGTAPGIVGRTVEVTGDTAGVSRSHCTVKLVDGRTVVDDHSSYGSLLNGSPVNGRGDLYAGDRLLLGRPGEELLAITVED